MLEHRQHAYVIWEEYPYEAPVFRGIYADFERAVEEGRCSRTGSLICDK